MRVSVQPLASSYLICQPVWQTICDKEDIHTSVFPVTNYTQMAAYWRQQQADAVSWPLANQSSCYLSLTDLSTFCQRRNSKT